MEIFAATGSGSDFPAETVAQPEKMTEKMTTQARSMNRESEIVRMQVYGNRVERTFRNDIEAAQSRQFGHRTALVQGGNLYQRAVGETSDLANMGKKLRDEAAADATVSSLSCLSRRV
jgi:hypothetical protein